MTLFSDDPATGVAEPAPPVITADLAIGGQRTQAPQRQPLRQLPHGTIRSTAEWFRITFEYSAMGTALFELGPDGQRWFLLANPAVATMFGVTADALLGRDLAEFSDRSYAEEDARIVQELRAGARHVEVRCKRYRRADGRQLRAEIRANRVDLPGHPGVTTLAHFMDVTAKHEAEEYRARITVTKAAVTSIVTQVLAGAPVEDIYRLVVSRVARLFDSENATLVLVDPQTGMARVVAGVGPVGAKMMSGELPVSQETTRRLIRMDGYAMPEPDPSVSEELRPLMGPSATARFGPETGGGLVAVSRPPGAPPYDPADVELLMTVAQQVALAIELGQARADTERLAVLEDRQRIARDLHDTVIQDLIAIGMQLDGRLPDERGPTRRERDGAIIEQLEEAIRRLRGSVFDLRETPRERSLDEGVRATASEAGRVLGHRPTVRLEGYLESVPPAVSYTILAVLREALSNVARHAQASATDIRLTVSGEEVRLVVDDDGRGLPEHLTPGNGLANVRDRATLLGGSATVTRRAARGTRLTWWCPCPSG